jgi:hypothetical protein
MQNDHEQLEEDSQEWHPLGNTKAYWIQTPTGTDKVWIDKRLYEQAMPFFPNNSFPERMGAMMMQYAKECGLPRSASGRILWKTGSGMNKSQVATAMLQRMVNQFKIDMTTHESSASFAEEKAGAGTSE